MIVLFLGAWTVVGALFGHPHIGLLLGLVLYLVWTLLQARKLYYFFDDPAAVSDAPESHGLWGDMFDGLQKFHLKHLRTQDKLQARINRVQESIEAMRDGVVMTDASGRIGWINGSAEHLLGLRRHSDQGQSIHNLVRLPAFKHYFDSRDYRDSLEMRSPHRDHLRLQIQITLFGDEDRLIVAKDVTRIFQLEQMRRDFVGNVSHEMRTPLTVISGYLETLQDSAEELPPKWRRALKTMSAQSSRMEALITDLILLSKIETGEQMVDDTVNDIRSMMEEICDDARALSGEAEHVIRLEVGSPTGLQGDEAQLRSAFSNLLFNAVKYTPGGGEITVRWWTDREGAHLAVRDTGIGIDPIHIPRLTERFYRADPSRHQETGGTGLGLAIVKHVLLNHDGQLGIHSEPGRGSEFVCHFPASRIAEPVTA